MNDWPLILNAASTWYCVGLIWFVQLVAYPQFARVSAGDWPAYHAAHMRFTTAVVAPVMFVELISAVWLVYTSPSPLIWVGLGLLALVWINTFAMEVPLHNRLKKSHDSRLIRSLVLGNWIRTIAWTARGVLLAIILAGR